MLRVLGRSAPPPTNCRASSPAAGGKHDELGPETQAGRGGGQDPSEKLARAPVLIRTQGRTSEPDGSQKLSDLSHYRQKGNGKCSPTAAGSGPTCAP